MPEISRFLGIVIAMYFKDHEPPHFHAKYGGNRAAFSIRDLRLIEGGLPPRIISLVLEWAFFAQRGIAGELEAGRAKRGTPENRAPCLRGVSCIISKMSGISATTS